MMTTIAVISALKSTSQRPAVATVTSEKTVVVPVPEMNAFILPEELNDQRSSMMDALQGTCALKGPTIVATIAVEIGIEGGIGVRCVPGLTHRVPMTMNVAERGIAIPSRTQLP